MNENAMRDFFKKFAPDTNFDDVQKMAQEMQRHRAQAWDKLKTRLENMPQQEKDDLGDYLLSRREAKQK